MRLIPKRPVRTVQRNRVMLRLLTALYELRAGRAGPEELHDVADCLNTMEALACMRKCDASEVRTLHGIAEAGLKACAEAHSRGGLVGVPQEALDAMSKLAGHYDRAMERLSSQTLDAANRLVIQRIVLGQAEVIEA